MTAAAIDTPAGRALLFRSFEAFGAIGLAVSGGPDSAAMMHLAAVWRDERRAAGQSAPRLVALTVDHGLRAGSAQEADVVAAWARGLGLEHGTLVWQGDKPATGVQAAAREARYRLLAGWAEAQDTPAAIAVAHTRDDQAETVLMRLARGSGADGLAAMRPVAFWGTVPILRPMLDTAKAALLSHLSAARVPFLEDPSNSLEHFERVRVRKAGPARAALGLANEALATTARRMSRAVEALEVETDRVLQAWCGTQPQLAHGVFRWPVRNDVAAEIQVRAMGRVLRCVGGAVAGAEPELAAVERLVERLGDTHFAGATLGRCQLTVDDGDVLIIRETGRLPLPVLRLQRGQSELWDGRFAVSFRSEMGAPVSHRVEVTALDAPLRLAIAGADPEFAVPDVPIAALAGLPLFLVDGEAAAVPSLGYTARPAVEDGLIFQVKFDQAGLFPQRPS